LTEVELTVVALAVVTLEVVAVIDEAFTEVAFTDVELIEVEFKEVLLTLTANTLPTNALLLTVELTDELPIVIEAVPIATLKVLLLILRAPMVNWPLAVELPIDMPSRLTLAKRPELLDTLTEWLNITELTLLLPTAYLPFIGTFTSTTCAELHRKELFPRENVSVTLGVKSPPDTESLTEVRVPSTITSPSTKMFPLTLAFPLTLSTY
jgi:hypothetical protein